MDPNRISQENVAQHDKTSNIKKRGEFALFLRPEFLKKLFFYSLNVKLRGDTLLRRPS